MSRITHVHEQNNNNDNNNNSVTSKATGPGAASASASASATLPINVCKEMLLPATNSRAARDALRDIIHMEHPRINMTFRRQGMSTGILLTVLTEG